MLLLGGSHIVRVVRHTDDNIPVGPCVNVSAVTANGVSAGLVRVAYNEYGSDIAAENLPVILLHGSPGEKENFNRIAGGLSKNHRLIIPDLPGFGNSSLKIPDYSFRAHARYVLEMMDALGIRRAHLVGFSMGGGVALNVADIAPDRVASITMMSAIGVQEMELLGDYHLNHAVHGLQLSGLWLIRNVVPDFGYLGNTTFAIAYARNFYDSDQRPLREILAHYQGPMLILHGREDELVPVEAALEHHRLAPQSQLELFDQNHFMVFDRNIMLADSQNQFLSNVDANLAVVRSTAAPERIAEASLPFTQTRMPMAIGMTAFILFALLAGATLVSEDLACISAGLLVAQGRLPFVGAAFACFLGIYVGDLLLFLAGRLIGRPVLRFPPFRWMVREESVARSSAWLSRNVFRVIISSRFLPGTRLPTYFAAGLLNTNFWQFAFYFLIAAAVWTPLLVGLSVALGAEALHSVFLAGQGLITKLLVVGVSVLVIAKLATSLSSFRGRRLLIGRFRRLARWEFWPPWVFYPPVILYVIYLMIRYRSLTLFTSTNPAIPAGGFIGESKSEILRGVGQDSEFVARFRLLQSSLDQSSRVAEANNFMKLNGLSFPVVLKPDAGQRGSGVAIVKSQNELEDYLTKANCDIIIQEHIPGLEFGVFYYRYPRELHGRILSITEKVFPDIVGDGISSLEKLILNDERAVCMANFYLDKHADNLSHVPVTGEKVRLVELGTHCRGAIFLDGGWVKTTDLETTIDAISKQYDGFYFGRFDIRTPSVDDFKQGRNFKIIELNGVTSESTDIYDPKNSVFAAYRALFNQWRIAFEIGAQNRASGVRPESFRGLIKSLFAYMKLSKSHL